MLPGDWEHFTPDSDIAYAGAEFNCFDESALALALRLKEDRQRAGLPVSCSAVTVGRRPPAPFSQTLYAQGFDEVAVIESEGTEFAPGDVASLLAGYIEEEGFDLVLTGSVAGMADSGTVPFWLANILNRPVFTEAQDLEYSAEGIAVTRQNEAGLWRYLVRPPMVLTIGNSFALLQAPTLKARLAAREQKPRYFTAAPAETPEAAATTLGFGRASAERSCRMMAEKDAGQLAQALLKENLLQRAEERSGAASPKNGFAFPEKTAFYLPQLREGLLSEGAEWQLAEDWLSRRPALAVLPQTPEGTLLATGLAARTGAALFTEAALLGWEQGRLLAQKRACAANIHWRVSLPLPAVVTLPRLPEKPPRITLSDEGKTPQWLAEAVPLAPPSQDELQNRRLIIICGLGVGRAACERARLLAKKLGAGFGLTRPAALEGWGRVDEIVGGSGVTITSEVSLVLGASGAGAFMCGLEAVSRIIAVNTDKQALIFKQADIGLLADAPALVEALLKRLEEDR